MDQSVEMIKIKVVEYFSSTYLSLDKLKAHRPYLAV